MIEKLLQAKIVDFLLSIQWNLFAINLKKTGQNEKNAIA